MTSIFRYPGSKSRLRAKIMSMAPAHYAEYREPFVGGGSVFFVVKITKRRWINDKDESLMAVYRALRDDPVSFIRACQQIKPWEYGEGKNRLKAVFDRFANNNEMDQALRYFFNNRTGFVGHFTNRKFFSNPQAWNIVTTDQLWQAASSLSKVQITSGDYHKLLQGPGDDVWIYCDPPYFVNNLVSPGSRLYRHIFTEEKHIQFAKEIKACAHKVLISYDDHPFIRRLYSEAGLRISTVEVPYCLSNGRTRQGKELLISNYDLPLVRRTGELIGLAR